MMPDLRDSPKISVIIPAYNRAHLIGETLRSLLIQTLPASEIIVVDDGSTDNTAEVAAAFGSPVRVIRQTNAGPAAARNTGFNASSGEYIHFFDSDDLAAPNKQEVQLNTLEKTGADIVISPWVKGQFVDGVFRAENHVLQQNGLPRIDLIEALLTHWSIVPHSALFRRSMVEAISGFDESLFIAEDQLMFLDCLLAGAKVVHAPGTIEFYRVGDGGKITENEEWSVRRLREWARFLIKAREACQRKGIDPLQWFGYRRRIWEVQEDLLNAKCEDQDLLNLLEIVPTDTTALTYHWHRQLERWRGGVQQRLTGGRAHRFFHIGKMNTEQVGQLAALGYEYRYRDEEYKTSPNALIKEKLGR